MQKSVESSTELSKLIVSSSSSVHLFFALSAIPFVFALIFGSDN